MAHVHVRLWAQARSVVDEHDRGAAMPLPVAAKAALRPVLRK